MKRMMINNIKTNIDIEMEKFKKELEQGVYTAEWHSNLDGYAEANFHMKLIQLCYFYNKIEEGYMNEILNSLNKEPKKRIYRLHNRIGNRYSRGYRTQKEMREKCYVEKLKKKLGQMKYNKIFIIDKEDYILKGNKYIKVQ